MDINPAQGRRAVIAGGCGGIGRATVQAFLRHGLDVAVIDHPAAIECHPQPKEVLALEADAGSAASLSAAFDRLASWPQIDILVFLIGISILPPKAATDISIEEWDRLMAVNLRAAWLCARCALPQLHRSNAGSIINVASSLAFNPNKGFSAYVATKGGIVSLTKAIAMENAPRVRANVVAPSAVDTEFLAGGTVGQDGADNAWFPASSYVTGIPLGRLAGAEDVVGPILFLAGEGARYITGQVLHVNGGRITP
ncbi:MAG: SDR family NAD(P)-dependent oxidoreductase [Pseudorhodoplanes sp.]|uniref:SDR family NAD(P)-dependent oxidoreductase n=1 Tax=Pseudorhodoplanes sp. TaxID=1934341 RepID=UPI003D0DAC8E